MHTCGDMNQKNQNHVCGQSKLSAFMDTTSERIWLKDHKASLFYVAMAHKFEKTEAAAATLISLNLLCINQL